MSQGTSRCAPGDEGEPFRRRVWPAQMTATRMSVRGALMLKGAAVAGVLVLGSSFAPAPRRGCAAPAAGPQRTW
jgi:hypothetical protein